MPVDSCRLNEARGKSEVIRTWRRWASRLLGDRRLPVVLPPVGLLRLTDAEVLSVSELKNLTFSKLGEKEWVGPDASSATVPADTGSGSVTTNRDDRSVERLLVLLRRLAKELRGEEGRLLRPPLGGKNAAAAPLREAPIGLQGALAVPPGRVLAFLYSSMRTLS